MKWGDTLCGVEVTPENWGWGGVVAYGEEWGIVDGNGETALMAVCGVGIENRMQTGIMTPAANLRPVFPPAGWAGKTDAELWREVFGDGWNDNGVQHPAFVECHKGSGVYLSIAGNAELAPGHMIAAPEIVPYIILGYQNAQVLQRRLQGVQP